MDSIQSKDVENNSMQTNETKNELEKSLIFLVIKNVKGVLAKITTFCSENDINIEKFTLSTFSTNTDLQKAILYVSGNRIRVNNLLEKLNQLDVVVSASNFQANNYIERELMLVKAREDDPSLSIIMNIVNEYQGSTILFKNKIIIFQFINEEEKNDELTQRLENISKDVEILKSGLIATSLE